MVNMWRMLSRGEQPHSPQVEGSQLRRSSRGHHPSTRYLNYEYGTLAKGGESESFQEVQTHKKRIHWMKSIQKEINSLKKNNTYELVALSELVALPKGENPLKNKWVFKLKKDRDKLIKHKAHLIVKDFN